MITITKLRENIYQLINEVIETGKPLIIKRKDGKEVVVSPIKKESRLARIKPYNGKKMDVESIMDIDWLEEWREEWGIENNEQAK